MSTTKNLLVELFVEELPPKALSKLGEAFAVGLFRGLERRRLLAPEAAKTGFASPRRLAAHVTSVASESAPQEVVERLLPVSVALDAAGRPTAAFRKRVDKTGRGRLVDAWPNSEDGADKLYIASDGKADCVFFRTLEPGQPLARGLADALAEAIEALPIPKVMTYQLADGWTSEKFVRPAHGLVALHGDEVVRVSALGLVAGRTTHGHRFEAAHDPIELRDADSYAQQLQQDGAVIAGFADRRGEIERQLRDAATKEGLAPIDDSALLDEVSALVERPNVLVCRFDEQFLAVPQECLILTMKANQKYFPLLDGAGRLTNRFLVVSNIRPADPSRVVEGNERVVRPRLADAKFFFDQDRKRTLESRLPGLDKVVYHGRLGSQGERVERVRKLAREIANLLCEQWGQPPGGPGPAGAQSGAALAARADRAAQLAKADLLTGMVGEFPELQGVMGRYYATHDGESDEVAFAIEDHYKPRFAGDTLPRSMTGIVVALADKLETLVGMFGIGQAPSGDKDPFALRRHALGVIRMLVERELPLDLDALLGLAAGQFPDSPAPMLPATKPRSEPAVATTYPAPIVVTEVYHFLLDRLAGSLRDQGYRAQEVEAVLALSPRRLADVPRRLAAVRAFAELPEAVSLAAANKRVGNILKKADGAVAAQVNATLLREPAEVALLESLRRVAPQADAAFGRGDYTASLQALAALKAPVDSFFDGVMVNADDSALRTNRLGLLATLHAAMNRVADLSKLAA